MRKSLGTKKKREAVEKVSAIITAELQRCPVDKECRLIKIEHAGAEVTIIGESTEQELAIAQSITRTKFTTKKIKDVLLAFCKEKTTDGSWTPKTAAENKRIAEHFIKSIGDVTTAKINYDTLNDYKHSLMESDKAIQTINKYLSRVGSFCSWMERHGYLEKNYAKGMQLKRTTSAHEDRERFTLDEVSTILSNLEPNDKKPHRYWLPLLGYYTGARLNELCQLHCCDIHDDIIDINKDTKDKRLKNRASKRIIPLHSELIRLEFEEFCNRKGRVFEELKPGRDGHSKNVSRWFK
jgi:integrase